MFSSLGKLWKTRVNNWLARRIPPRSEVRLNQRLIYIVPSRNGMLFVLAAALVFIAAINYAVSLAFGLAFLMASLFVLGILYTFNNLNGLTLRALPARAVFCGEEAAFAVELSRNSRHGHESLELGFPQGTMTDVDLVNHDRERVEVFTRALKRGEFKAPLLRIGTVFPLGLVRAWSILDLDMHCLVYPRPVAFTLEQFHGSGSGSNDAAMNREGSEEFYGLREYVPGDAMRQVAWKNVARGQGMQVKQFVDYVDDRLWLDWDMFYGFAVEERLSRLCYGVLQLSASGKAYGMKLPGIEIQPDCGARHRDRLLRILALYEPD